MRTAIFLDSIEFLNRTNELRLRGDLNGKQLSELKQEADLPYTLQFSGVLASRVTELDTWESQKNWYNDSSFDEIENSEWIATLGGKIGPEHRHFIVSTYDDVIEVIATDYSLQIDETTEPASSPQLPSSLGQLGDL